MLYTTSKCWIQNPGLPFLKNEGEFFFGGGGGGAMRSGKPKRVDPRENAKNRGGGGGGVGVPTRMGFYYPLAISGRVEGFCRGLPRGFRWGLWFTSR